MLNERGEENQIKWLETDPFPELRTREIIDVVGEFIVQNQFADRPIEGILENRELEGSDKTIVLNFVRDVGLRFLYFPEAVRHSYGIFWSKVWDTVGYHELVSRLGQDEPNPESGEAMALGIRARDSAYTQETIRGGAKFCDRRGLWRTYGSYFEEGN